MKIIGNEKEVNEMFEHDGCNGCKEFSKTKGVVPVTSDMRCYECTAAHKVGGLSDLYQPMTNADRIRAMTDEELAKFIQKIKTTCFVDFIGYANKDCEQDKISCKDCQAKAPTILEWLQSEAE